MAERGIHEKVGARGPLPAVHCEVALDGGWAVQQPAFRGGGLRRALLLDLLAPPLLVQQSDVFHAANLIL